MPIECRIITHFLYAMCLKGNKLSEAVTWISRYQTEIMMEMCSNILFRATDEVTIANNIDIKS